MPLSSHADAVPRAPVATPKAYVSRIGTAATVIAMTAFIAM